MILFFSSRTVDFVRFFLLDGAWLLGLRRVRGVPAGARLLGLLVELATYGSLRQFRLQYDNFLCSQDLLALIAIALFVVDRPVMLRNLEEVAVLRGVVVCEGRGGLRSRLLSSLLHLLLAVVPLRPSLVSLELQLLELGAAPLGAQFVDYTASHRRLANNVSPSEQCV